jgi:23S rRNA (guanosine2251-2'-O)-methyltransferase
MEKLYGKHSVRAAFLTRPESIRRMILAGKESYYEEFLELAREHGVKPEFMAWPEFLRTGKFGEDDKHQGIAVFTDPREIYGEGDLDSLAGAHVVLALDQINDPQNLGTILRTAAFFGVDAVLLLRNRSADITPLVVRVAVGGAEFVKIFRVTNLARSLEKLKQLGFWIYGLDERGERTLAETKFDDKAVLVIGAEGQGLRQRTRQTCDALVRIPGGRRGVESLNAGVATAVALGELFRRSPAAA